MAAEGSRTVGIGMDYSPTSKVAVRWAVDNLVCAGDHVVLIHVLSKSDHHTEKQLWEEHGSRTSLPLPRSPLSYASMNENFLVLTRFIL